MSFQVDDSGAVLEIKYISDVDDEMILDCLDEILASAGYFTKDQLVDYTAVTNYRVTIPGLKRLTDVINSHTAKHGNRDRRTAYIVPEDIEYGMGRVFLAHIESSDDRRLFRTRTEACAWLGIDDNGELPSAC